MYIYQPISFRRESPGVAYYKSRATGWKSPNLLLTCKSILAELLDMYDPFPVNARITPIGNPSPNPKPNRCEAFDHHITMEFLSVTSALIPKVQHIWLCIDDDMGVELPKRRSSDSPKGYAAMLSNLAAALNMLTGLQRFEIEWEVVVDRAEAEGRINPRYRALIEEEYELHGKHLPRHQIKDYGHIVGWRDSESGWKIKFFEEPGVFSWLSGKIKGIEHVWARQSPKIDFNGIPISELMSEP